MAEGQGPGRCIGNDAPGRQTRFTTLRAVPLPEPGKMFTRRGIIKNG